MAKAKPVVHIQLSDADGHKISDDEGVTLSDKQIDWLAEFFAPIVKESFVKVRASWKTGAKEIQADG